MRVVYMDEAGTGDPVAEPFVVVAGVIVHGDHQLGKVRKCLEQVVADHIPESQRRGLVLHAAELFNGGKGPFNRHDGLSRQKRREIAHDLAAIPKLVGLTLTVGWMRRDEFLAHDPAALATFDPKELPIGPLLTAHLLCSTHIEQWMRRYGKQEHCLLVVEDNPNARRRMAELHRAHQDPRIVDGLSVAAKQLFPFHRIVEDPLFQAKRSANPLELADFLAFVGKRLLMKPDDPEYMPYFRQMQSQLFEHSFASSGLAE